MNFNDNTITVEPELKIQNYLKKIGKDEIVSNILNGLTSSNKSISSIFFYDQTGTKLFEDITHLPEYYPTRTEKYLLKQIAPIVGKNLHNIDLIELGSGDCSKISILIEQIWTENINTIRYIPIDISQSAIEQSGRILQKRFPGLQINGILADFMKQLHMIPVDNPRFICFFGSTIGNLTRKEACDFFLRLGFIMNPGDRLLLGLDMVKNKNVIEKAYNDKQQVTAQFNQNILNVVNNLTKTDFDPENFEHLAYYNQEQSRIEMHLKAKNDMTINSPYLTNTIESKKGETIHTENSHKFTKQIIQNLADLSELSIQNIYTDEKKWFSLVEFIK